MSRLLPFLCAATAFSALFSPGLTASTQLANEVHELRRDLQMQGRKIDSLTQKIADLTAHIKQREEARPSPQPSPAAVAQPTVSTPSAITPAVVVPRAVPVAAGPPPEVPKATPQPTVPHVVAKGETLTGIAKQYNVSLSDLLKLNKNTNDRRLQIGQTLKVPAVKPAEAAPSAPPETAPVTP
jgi:LysM repeat protein